MAFCSVGDAAGPRIVQVTRCVCGEVRGEGICAGAPRELGLVELEDPLEQREHVRRQLARERACELSLVGVGVLRPPLHLEVVAQHVRSKGEEAVLSGGGDQQHVLLAAQRRQRAELSNASRHVAAPLL